MMGKSHAIIGITTGVCALTITGYIPNNPDPIIISSGLLCALVGGLFPDIDEPNSMIWSLAGIGHSQSKRNLLNTFKKKNFAYLLLAFLQFLLGLVVKGFTSLIPHRGITHYLLFGIVVTALFSTGAFCFNSDLAAPLSVCFGLGYLSHTLADACTRSGVKLLYPFSKDKIYLLPYSFRIKTGSAPETILLIVIEVFLAVLTAISFTVLNFSTL